MGVAFGGKIFHAVSKKDTRKIPQQAAGMGVKLTTDGSGRPWVEALASPRRLRGYAHSHDDQQDSACAAWVKATIITSRDNASP
jgi:hypothetical protein